MAANFAPTSTRILLRFASTHSSAVASRLRSREVLIPASLHNVGDLAAWIRGRYRVVEDADVRLQWKGRPLASTRTLASVVGRRGAAAQPPLLEVLCAAGAANRAPTAAGGRQKRPRDATAETAPEPTPRSRRRSAESLDSVASADVERQRPADVPDERDADGAAVGAPATRATSGPSSAGRPRRPGPGRPPARLLRLGALVAAAAAADAASSSPATTIWRRRRRASGPARPAAARPRTSPSSSSPRRTSSRRAGRRGRARPPLPDGHARADTLGNLRRHYAKHNALRETELALFHGGAKLPLLACARDRGLAGDATIEVRHQARRRTPSCAPRRISSTSSDEGARGAI
ncbi:hypothetical protein JL722_10102 [Aureococcus anophagefferens]|nr:hypothetical protein JL722_10102 [Aureococcus anophagefferens]